MGKRLGSTSKFFVLFLTLGLLLGGRSFSAEILMAGYWTTDLSSGTPGQMTLIAIPAGGVASIELGYAGQPAGVNLLDDGQNGDFAAGDGVYGLQLDFPASPELSVLLELFPGGVTPILDWPYLNVMSGGPMDTPTPSPSPSPTMSPTPTPVPTLNPNCNPFAYSECVLPYPSQAFLTDDSTTETGYRVNFPDNVFPYGNDPHRLNISDGFGRNTGLLAEFAGDLNLGLIPDFYDIQATIVSNSRFICINADQNSPEFGRWHPLHVNTFSNGTNVAVAMRSADPFEPNTRYVVAIRNLYDYSGNMVGTNQLFADLRDSVPGHPDYTTWEPIYAQIFGYLDSVGVDRDSLNLAWTFHTASTSSTTSLLMSLREQGLANFDPATAELNLTFRGTVQGGRYYEGFIKGPSFISGQSFDLNASTHLPNLIDPAFPYGLYVYVPSAVAAGRMSSPVPSYLYGHGLFGTGDGVADFGRDFAEDLNFVALAFDWQGATSGEELRWGIDIIPRVISNMNKVSDRLLQSELNAYLISKVRGRIADVITADIGNQVMDKNLHFYMGNSWGGWMGAAQTAINEEIIASALLVTGGGFLNQAMQSSYWTDPIGPTSFGELFDSYHQDPISGQACLIPAQQVFDAVDPLSYARHWTKEVFPHMPGKRHVLLQQGINDPVVPAFCTEMLMRETEYPLLEPYVEAMLRVPTAPVPTNGTTYGGIFQYAIGAHGAGLQPDALDQKRDFFHSFYRTGYGAPGNIQ